MIKITIIGKLTHGSLFKSYSKLLSLSLSAKQVLLFCDYSEFEIPLEQEFELLQDADDKMVFRGRICLKGVTQQFEKLFDQIPKGWKTICKFEITSGDYNQFLKVVPEVNSWYSNHPKLVMSTEYLEQPAE